MKPKSHSEVTLYAWKLLNSEGIKLSQDIGMSVSSQANQTDYFKDMEFVDVDYGRDNPHKGGIGDDDEAHHSTWGHELTCFNHFIDIKKGPGIFDDFDGYSYKNGSASKEQYMKFSAAADSWWEKVGGALRDYWIDKDPKVDDGVMWWLKDEYVHAPGHEWYQKCSEAISCYSFYRDKGRYKSVKDEAKERFPRVSYSIRGGFKDYIKGKGVPYSVFMPVDNLGRYWYNKFINPPKSIKNAREKYRLLGSTMHALQDATVPHHAAGYLGNWHQRYESDLAGQMTNWFKDRKFKNAAITLFKKWKDSKGRAPKQFSRDDWKLTPNQNWRVDKLITWLALNAYRSYSQLYRSFKYGYRFKKIDARHLTINAVAMNMLVWDKARIAASKKARANIESTTRVSSVGTRGVRDHRNIG